MEAKASGAVNLLKIRRSNFCTITFYNKREKERLKMNVFNIIAGVASIVSLIVSILVLKGLHEVKIKIGFTDKSRTKISQKATGRGIQQAGGDMNA